MTPKAIHNRTGIPLKILECGLQVLEAPDPPSRSTAEEGRRIVRLDPGRAWGWRLVNYQTYRWKVSAEEKREYNRQYMENMRHKNTHKINRVADSSTESRQVAEVAQARSKKQEAVKQRTDIVAHRATARELLDFLNAKTGRAYRQTPANLDLIIARLNDGATAQQCRWVIARKCREWGADPRMSVYLRPATLFNRTKFEQYVGECVAESDDSAPAASPLATLAQEVAHALPKLPG